MSTTPLVCQICKKPKSPNNGMIAELIRPSLLEFIKKKVPNLDSKGFICFEDLGEFRKDYAKEVLEDEIGELSALDQEVVESLEQHEILSADISKQFERKLTFGERLSDRIAEFGGSWKFLTSFDAVLLIWIAINGIILATRAFDPYRTFQGIARRISATDVLSVRRLAEENIWKRLTRRAESTPRADQPITDLVSSEL